MGLKTDDGIESDVLSVQVGEKLDIGKEVDSRAKPGTTYGGRGSPHTQLCIDYVIS